MKHKTYTSRLNKKPFLYTYLHTHINKFRNREVLANGLPRRRLIDTVRCKSFDKSPRQRTHFVPRMIYNGSLDAEYSACIVLTSYDYHKTQNTAQNGSLSWNNFKIKILSIFARISLARDVRVCYSLCRMNVTKRWLIKQMAFLRSSKENSSTINFTHLKILT